MNTPFLKDSRKACKTKKPRFVSNYSLRHSSHLLRSLKCKKTFKKDCSCCSVSNTRKVGINKHSLVKKLKPYSSAKSSWKRDRVKSAKRVLKNSPRRATASPCVTGKVLSPTSGLTSSPVVVCLSKDIQGSNKGTDSILEGRNCVVNLNNLNVYSEELASQYVVNGEVLSSEKVIKNDKNNNSQSVTFSSTVETSKCSCHLKTLNASPCTHVNRSVHIKTSCPDTENRVIPYHCVGDKRKLNGITSDKLIPSKKVCDQPCHRSTTKASATSSHLTRSSKSTVAPMPNIVSLCSVDSMKAEAHFNSESTKDTNLVTNPAKVDLSSESDDAQMPLLEPLLDSECEESVPSSPEMPKLVPFIDENEKPSACNSSPGLDKKSSSTRNLDASLERGRIESSSPSKYLTLCKDLPSFQPRVMVKKIENNSVEAAAEDGEVDIIDGMEFYSFYTEKALLKFSKTVENLHPTVVKDFCMDDGSSMDGDPRTTSVHFSMKRECSDDVINSDLEDLVSKEGIIMPRKTTDITKIKGWRHKHFAQDVCSSDFSSDAEFICVKNEDYFPADCDDYSLHNSSDQHSMAEFKSSTPKVPSLKTENVDYSFKGAPKEYDSLPKNVKCAFFSNNLNEFIRIKSQLRVPYLTKLNPNITPPAPGSGVLLLCDLKKPVDSKRTTCFKSFTDIETPVRPIRYSVRRMNRTMSSSKESLEFSSNACSENDEKEKSALKVSTSEMMTLRTRRSVETKSENAKKKDTKHNELKEDGVGKKDEKQSEIKEEPNKRKDSEFKKPMVLIQSPVYSDGFWRTDLVDFIEKLAINNSFIDRVKILDFKCPVLQTGDALRATEALLAYQTWLTKISNAKRAEEMKEVKKVPKEKPSPPEETISCVQVTQATRSRRAIKMPARFKDSAVLMAGGTDIWIPAAREVVREKKPCAKRRHSSSECYKMKEKSKPFDEVERAKDEDKGVAVKTVFSSDDCDPDNQASLPPQKDAHSECGRPNIVRLSFSDSGIRPLQKESGSLSYRFSKKSTKCSLSDSEDTQGLSQTCFRIKHNRISQLNPAGQRTVNSDSRNLTDLSDCDVDIMNRSISGSSSELSSDSESSRSEFDDSVSDNEKVHDYAKCNAVVNSDPGKGTTYKVYSERVRRKEIFQLFERLKNLLPNASASKLTPRVQILQEATQIIGKLKKRSTILEQENIRLNRRRKVLQAFLGINCTDDAPKTAPKGKRSANRKPASDPDYPKLSSDPVRQKLSHRQACLKPAKKPTVLTKRRRSMDSRSAAEEELQDRLSESEESFYCRTPENEPVEPARDESTTPQKFMVYPAKGTTLTDLNKVAEAAQKLIGPCVIKRVKLRSGQTVYVYRTPSETDNGTLVLESCSQSEQSKEEAGVQADGDCDVLNRVNTADTCNVMDENQAILTGEEDNQEPMWSSVAWDNHEMDGMDNDDSGGADSEPEFSPKENVGGTDDGGFPTIVSCSSISVEEFLEPEVEGET